MTPHPQSEAKRDISSVNFNVVLTGLEIDTILSAVGTATSLWAKNRRHMPGSFNIKALSSGCDKLTKPVEEDYQNRCASHSSAPSEQEIRKDAIHKFMLSILDVAGNDEDYLFTLGELDTIMKEELRSKQGEP
jgi:hypothetical protein